jgi:hypothetical protein
MNQQSRFQFGIRTLLVTIAVVAIVLGGGLALINLASRDLIHAVMVGRTGPVTSQKDWPEPLQKMMNELGEVKLDPTSIQVYCLCHGMDPEYVWRMDAAPGLFEQIASKWKLTEVEDPKWRILSGASSLSGVATPSWWSPQKDKAMSYYVCPQTLAGETGNRFQVALDKEQNTVFVHYWFNF